MSIIRTVASLIITGFVVWGCSGPKPPEPVESGPAAVIAIDSITTGPGTVEVPLRLSYLPGGRERLDSLGGFIFVITYDTTMVTFVDSTSPGEAISRWRVFSSHGNERVGNGNTTLNAMYINARRLQPYTSDPAEQQGYPDGVLATLRFTVAADPALSGRTAPICFRGGGCYNNTLYADIDDYRFYMADARLGGASADAALDTMVCARRQMFEPVLQFVHGAVQIEEFEYSSTAAIIAVEPARALFGSEFSVPITIGYPKYMIDPQVPFGGFDLLIEYDTTGIDLIGATRGAGSDAWEYFTWRSIPRHCDTCCSQLVRLVSIWDMNNGLTPDWSTRYLAGAIAMLQFRADNNPALINTVNEIGFLTLDCGDNSISSFDGSTLYLADPDDPECDTRAVPPDECTVVPRPDRFIEQRLRFRSGRVTISGP